MGLPKRAGLTLLEVIVAMAILLLSLVAIGRLVDIGSDRGTEARFQTHGTWLAQAKMAEVEAGAVALTAAGSGTFEVDPEWEWSVEPTPAGPPNVYTVTVRVHRDFRGRPFEVALTQMILDPAATGSSAGADATGGTTP